ncbi:MAG: hypothetical protein HGB19_12855 [Chlorobiales bacterium]|jgi:hypothetical protein|nr:hypothetical protein [Chlorobiales bacterium]
MDTTNVTFNACQKSYYDWVVATTPIFISTAVAVIGYLQYKVNRRKFRLDLYNRRFLVYEKSLAYFQSYYSRDSTAEFKESFERDFIRVYRESIFLFGEDSAVYKILTELKDTLGFLISFDSRFKSEPYNQNEYTAWSLRKQSMKEPSMIMGALEKALLPWLSFKKIEK